MMATWINSGWLFSYESVPVRISCFCQIDPPTEHARW